MNSKEELKQSAKHAAETTEGFKKDSKPESSKEETADTDALGKTKHQENQYGKTSANPDKEREAMPDTASKEQMPNKGIEAAREENTEATSADKTFKDNKPVEGGEKETPAKENPDAK